MFWFWTFFLSKPKLQFYWICTLVLFAYRKVASSRLSRLVAHPRIFRRLMKGKFDPYVLWPLAKKFQNWINSRPFYCSRLNTVCAPAWKLFSSAQLSLKIFSWNSSLVHGMILLKTSLTKVCKVHIFWEGYTILQNIHLTFVLCSASQK